MKLRELLAVFDPGTRVAIDYNDLNLFPYKVADLVEDTVFYDLVKDKEVTEVWSSIVYNAIVIKVE